ncbi:hypothetical protein K1514_15435 [Paraclostridium bifermentans]|uniref:hypothetical protein n=1 Tax=Paraclostridium TaxID=1849822 RepID=UPI001CC6E8C9|nr:MULTISPECIES: hypothetical protein [Paraclostridium]MBZ6007285.1 hypothetical protein [Paraclostridium bifermentans]MDU0297447.1 hypothetical protein [Paraclostridium sp. MRS3W1]
MSIYHNKFINSKKTETKTNSEKCIRGEILNEGTKIAVTNDRPSLASKLPPKPNK